MRGFALVGTGALALYLVAAAVRSEPLYEYAKSRGRDFGGTLHRPDATLGFAHIPGARGQILFPVGAPIPTQYDGDGFRVPAGAADHERRRPLVLALGDSCTYGDACAAEDAYPHRLARILGGSEINAGVCGYGLAQMEVVAGRLIPALRPDVVVVQYSPWLVSRARSHLAPAYYESVSTPFFFAAGETGMDLYPPLAANLAASIPAAALSEYRDGDRGPADRLSFVVRAGIPRVIRSDLVRVVYALAGAAGRIPEPAAADDVVSYVYGRIARLCRANGARMVVLVLGNGEDRVSLPASLATLDATIVDGDAALFGRLERADGEAYRRAYAHYRGSPPELVDTHPNERAHAILAGEIAAALARAGPEAAAVQTAPADAAR